MNHETGISYRFFFSLLFSFVCQSSVAEEPVRFRVKENWNRKRIELRPHYFRWSHIRYKAYTGHYFSFKRKSMQILQNMQAFGWTYIARWTSTTKFYTQSNELLRLKPKLFQKACNWRTMLLYTNEIQVIYDNGWDCLMSPSKKIHVQFFVVIFVIIVVQRVIINSGNTRGNCSILIRTLQSISAIYSQWWKLPWNERVYLALENFVCVCCITRDLVSIHRI